MQIAPAILQGFVNEPVACAHRRRFAFFHRSSLFLHLRHNVLMFFFFVLLLAGKEYSTVESRK